MEILEVKIDGHTYQVEVEHLPQDEGELKLRVDGELVNVIMPDRDAPADRLDWMVVDDKPYEISFDQNFAWIKDQTGVYRVELRHLADRSRNFRRRNGMVKAPIPGQVSQVLVNVGQEVETGAPIAILEAMKMFNEIRAPCSGRVKSIHVRPGENVSRGQALVEIGE